MTKIKKKLQPQKNKPIIGLKGTRPDTFTFLTNKRKNKPDYWITWWKRKNTATRVMVNLELENGMHRVFLVTAKDGGFKYGQKQFLFDDESKYYNVENNIWCYDYHENISIPIKRVFPSVEITKAIENERDIEVEYALNPLTIKRFAISKIAEGIMKGQALDEAIRRLLYITLIGTLASVFLLILFMFKTGMFNQITGAVGV